MSTQDELSWVSIVSAPVNTGQKKVFCCMDATCITRKMYHLSRICASVGVAWLVVAGSLGRHPICHHLRHNLHSPLLVSKVLKGATVAIAEGGADHRMSQY